MNTISIIEAIKKLSAICDGAQEKDYSGFSAADQWVKQFSSFEFLTEFQEREILPVINKYRHTQLGGMEIVLSGSYKTDDVIRAHQQHLIKKNIKKSVTFTKDQAILGFEYNEMLLGSIRNLKSRKFDPETKTWVCGRYLDTRNLLEEYSFNYDKNTMFRKQRMKSVIEKTAGLMENQIYCKFPYNPDSVNQIKTINGARWNAKDKYWAIPMSIKNIEILKTFGYSLKHNLSEWYEKEKENQKIIESKAQAITSIPGLNGELFPYQTQGVQFIESKNGRCLVADEMGLGKTLQSLAWLQLHKDEAVPVLIVCPASLKYNWKKEVLKWTEFEEQDIIILNGTKIQQITQKVIIINYDILKDWSTVLNRLPVKLMILDESHYIKNEKTLRYKAVKQIECANLIALTGTPIENRPLEILSTINLINSKIFPSNFKFKMKYCGAKHNGYGWDFSGATNVQELHEILTKEVMIRRKKADVLTELPDKIFQFVPLEIDNTNEYELAESDFEEYLKNEVARDFAGDDEKLERLKNEKVKTANILSQIEKLKQLAAKGKMKQAIEWIENFIESGEKLVLFCEHREIMDLFYQHFKGIAVQINGSVSLQNRNNAVEQFQNNPDVKLFLGNAAAETGLTLTSASNVAIYEYPWTPGKLMQRIDRCHRIGQKNAVNVYYLTALNTIDTKIASLLDEKQKVLDSVLDGKQTDSSNLLMELLSQMK